jgi:hypothetical protein
MDFRLIDNDIDLTNGELTFVTGPEAIAQDITMALRTWLGETPYDRGAGVPYISVIFARGEPLESIRLTLERKVLSRPGVLAVQLTPEIDTLTRSLTVTGTVKSIDGNVVTFAVDVAG